MRIFVGHNFFGAGNFGDDLTIGGFLNVAAGYPDVEIIACTPHDRASQVLRFPRVRWLPENDVLRENALRDADAWLGLGDTPFQLDSGPWLLDHNERERLRCAAHGKPMYLLGVGCESPEAAADPRAKALLAAAEHVWTRDAQSARMLRRFIAPPRLSVGADLANLVFSEPAPDRETGILGMLLAFEQRQQLDLAELETFLARRPPLGTRWLVQESRTLPYVERWILDNVAADVRRGLSVMDVDYTTCSTADYLRAFGAPEVTATSRYHGALVAAWHGSRVLVVARSAKLRGIATEFGLPQIDRADSHAALETALASAAAVPRERLRVVQERARTMCEEFFEYAAARRFVSGSGTRGN